MQAIYNYLNNTLQHATTLDALITCHLSQPSYHIWPLCLYIPGLSEEKQIQWKQRDWNQYPSLGTFRSKYGFRSLVNLRHQQTNIILHDWNHHHCLSNVGLEADNTSRHILLTSRLLIIVNLTLFMKIRSIIFTCILTFVIFRMKQFCGFLKKQLQMNSKWM